LALLLAVLLWNPELALLDWLLLLAFGVVGVEAVVVAVFLLACLIAVALLLLLVLAFTASINCMYKIVGL